MKNVFKFCPQCQKSIKKTNRLIQCQYCHFNFYLNPVPTNGLILENNNGEILLVKRKFPPKKDYWDIPGGFINFKETVEESLVREIKEELGINLNNFVYFSSCYDNYLYKKINYQTLCLIFVKKNFQGEIITNDDISQAKFFKKSEINFKKIAFKGIAKALKNYLTISF